MHGDDTGRILTAVLQQQQRVIDELIDRLLGNHADDAAHEGSPFSKGLKDKFDKNQVRLKPDATG
ncbi:hypothetical protein, partial [Ideonella sp.]|uniref:hypothetical protein n=1 Tax=Ideonella sp. TaxID=1929293 RepID=UPI003BB68310